MNEAVCNDDYLANMLKTWSEPSTSTLPWLDQLRSEAVDCVNALKMPTTRDEEWRFTDISPLIKLPFQVAKEPSQLKIKDIDHFFLGEAKIRMVFVDGQYSPQLSCITHDNDIIVGNLSALISCHSSEIATHLGQYTDFKNNVFAALNTSYLHDGALILVPHNKSVTAPIHLLFISTQKEVTSYSRCLIIAESSSNVTVIEDYVALQEVTYVTNSVTEISIADNAQVNHIRIQRESDQAFHIADCTASLAQGSQYKSTSVALGARISRYDLNVKLADEGAECSINGLALIKGQQLADTHTFIDHIKPNGCSQQLHKCIVDDTAHAVFNGKIMVRPKAQCTNSTQSSRNLLLSGKAQVDTKPQLEIFADDVKCAHGATVGQLDNEEIFYLRSRGLSEITARNLLTYAFGAEILERIPVISLRHQLEQTVLKQTQRN
ncbi:MAG: Fe-S cluster assembly protein SufD [Nitrosomonas sp.]|nr:Fe-S cluster assembly protein SufD [Nitrosomonas sp.]MDP1950777.1 Fe-S cluster assembly protein SufD [Nitrosomonas sp.]